MISFQYQDCDENEEIINETSNVEDPSDWGQYEEFDDEMMEEVENGPSGFTTPPICESPTEVDIESPYTDATSSFSSSAEVITLKVLDEWKNPHSKKVRSSLHSILLSLPSIRIVKDMIDGSCYAQYLLVITFRDEVRMIWKRYSELKTFLEKNVDLDHPQFTQVFIITPLFLFLLTP